MGDRITNAHLARSSLVTRTNTLVKVEFNLLKVVPVTHPLP